MPSPAWSPSKLPDSSDPVLPPAAVAIAPITPNGIASAEAFGVSAISVANNVTFSGAQIASLSSTVNLSAAGTNAPAVQASKTIVVLFWWSAGTSPAYVAGLWEALDVPGLNGWALAWNNAVTAINISVFNGATSQNITIGAPVAGLNCIAITVTAGNSMHVSLNGAAAVATALTISPTVPGASATHSIGKGHSAFHGWDVGGILHTVALNRAASDAEIVAWSGVVYPTVAANRYALPASLTTDSAVTFDWLASRDWNGIAGTSTSQGTIPVTFTVNGAVALTAMSESYTTNLTNAFADSLSAVPVAAPVGSGNYYKANTFGRIRFTAPINQPQIAVAYINNDATAGAAAVERAPVYKDGAWLVDVPSAPTQTSIALTWVQLSAYNVALAAHTVDVWAPETEDPTAAGGTPLGGYLAGVVTGAAPTFNVTRPNKGLTCYGDSVTCSSFANTGGTGWVARVRQDFPTAGGPGGVTVEAFGGRRLFDDVGGIGAPNAATFAAKLVSECQLATTSSKTLLIWIGVNDLGSSAYTAGQFGTALQALINAVTALDSQIAIFVMNLPQPSRLGYNATIATLTGCTKIDCTGWGITFSDGLHPDAASQSTIKTNLKTALAY
jgi:hypothetical protein